MTVEEFTPFLQAWYKSHGRTLPWRPPELPLVNGQLDSYKILLSEIMLQQTQVARVVDKYEQFIKAFPKFTDLANASQKQVLELWQGLGYNRRALYLHTTAKNLSMISDNWTSELLAAQPGIGPNTAAAICVYAYNQPLIFIETNIRTVYLHHFFPDQSDVSDKKLLPLITATLDTKNPREWYWALMDYGSYVKKTYPNPSRRSRHHVKQSTFIGSKRQLRGQVLKQLLAGPTSAQILVKQLPDERLPEVLSDLEKEGFVAFKNSVYHIL